jgi:nucleotide-binding universal stress UspA family protein
VVLDGSSIGRAAAEYGIWLAGVLAERLIVLGVVDPWINSLSGDAPQLVDYVDLVSEYLQRECAGVIGDARERGVDAWSDVRVGPRVEEIIGAINDEQITLVVVGAWKRSIVHRLLGYDLAEALTRYSPVPVVVVRPDQHAVDRTPLPTWLRGESSLA